MQPVVFVNSSGRHRRVPSRDLRLWTLLCQHPGNIWVFLSTGLPLGSGPALLHLWVTSVFQLFLGSTAISHFNVTVNRNKPNVSKESHFYHSTNIVLCLALYGRELEEEEEDEEEDEEQLEVHRLPDLLFRKAPQLLQYTAALHTRYSSDHDNHDDSDGSDNEKDFGIQRDRRGELRLDSHIGTVKSARDDI